MTHGYYNRGGYYSSAVTITGNTVYMLKVKTPFLVDCATVSNGEIGFCNCNTCSEKEGDCDAHDECQDGLFCGLDNCQASLGFDLEVDCCSTTGKI